MARGDEAAPARTYNRAMSANTHIGPRGGAERLLAVRRPLEVGYWLVSCALSAIGNTLTARIDVARAGLPFADWEIATWEASSALSLLMLVPLVVAFTARWPVHVDNWLRRVPLYLLASVAWSLLHVGLMVAMRKLVYAMQGSAYVFGDAFGYEYLKDARTFALIVTVDHGYRWFWLRLQGEEKI